MSKIKDNIPFIKIPVDFESLNDLGELVTNYDLVSRLANALNGYQDNYIRSFLKTKDEVLEYIPQSHHSDYKVLVRGEADWEYPDSTRKKFDLHKRLKTKHVHDKIFMVDTTHRVIDTCIWASTKNAKCDVEYIGQPEYTVDIKERKLVVGIRYSFGATQSVGGAWINGRATGYLINSKSIPYTIYGHDKHEFCTRTNRYLGYKGYEQDPYRRWQS